MLGLGGRKSRNKVIVGEPAIGSFSFYLIEFVSVNKYFFNFFNFDCYGGYLGLGFDEGRSISRYFE